MRDREDIMSTPENKKLRAMVRDCVRNQDGRMFVAICKRYGKGRVEMAIAYDYDAKDDFSALVGLGIDLVHIIQYVRDSLTLPDLPTGEDDAGDIPF
jgi:hypothetical protein